MCNGWGRCVIDRDGVFWVMSILDVVEVRATVRVTVRVMARNRYRVCFGSISVGIRLISVMV